MAHPILAPEVRTELRRHDLHDLRRKLEQAIENAEPVSLVDVNGNTYEVDTAVASEHVRREAKRIARRPWIAIWLAVFSLIISLISWVVPSPFG